MNRMLVRLLRPLPLLGLTLLLAACLPKVAPPYSGGLASEPTNLKAYVDDDAGIRMMLAPGWVSQPVNSPDDTEIKAHFSKTGTSAQMLVSCQGMFVSRAGLPIKPLNQINAVTVSNERLWADQSLGGGNFDPEFSAWTGMVESKGQRVPMNFYIAWKLPSRIGGCKYALWTIVGRAEAKQIEGDFLAMARSLQ
jgi:hypothetical protein